ncbi:hypothetical protein BCR43DRAFT_436527, partial [Syncephalastrum racemosum]
APPNFELLSREAKVDFQKPYPDEERMRRGLLYWQHSDTSTSPRSDASQKEVRESEQRAKRPSSDETAQSSGDPFWILDLNPDLES